jgi:hypothetical protein
MTKQAMRDTGKAHSHSKMRSIISRGSRDSGCTRRLDAPRAGVVALEAVAAGVEVLRGVAGLRMHQITSVAHTHFLNAMGYR